jgi:large subunit ribosomal protein L1
LDVDTIIATPDLMGEVGKLGKILGPKGMMPNPKSGTVTFEVAKAVQDAKAGKIEYRVDKGSNIHVPVGKMSFDEKKLMDNITVLITELIRAKPSASKGRYLKSLTLSPTMGPSIRLDAQQIFTEMR